MATPPSPTDISDDARQDLLRGTSRWAPRRSRSPLSPVAELQRQALQLRRRRGLDQVNEDLFEERKQAISARLDGLRSGVATLPTADDTVAHGVLARAWQRMLTRLVHPAASWLPPRWTVLKDNRNRIAEGLAQGWAVRRTFWAADQGAALLDGLVIAKEDARDTAGKPHLFVVVGFAQAYESIVKQAKGFADDFDVVVVLHNSRGVGRSLGVQYTVDQAVEDCKAVIRDLRGRGHSYLGAYGVSMGSATALRAIEQLAASGELSLGDIGVAVSVRGLSSIPHVVGAHLGRAFAAAARWLLRRANLPEMDVTEVLQERLPIDELMVTTATADCLVKGRGQLAQTLGLRDSTAAVLPSGQPVTLVRDHGHGHIDPNVRTPEHDAVLRRWADRARQRYAARQPALADATAAVVRQRSGGSTEAD